MWGADVEGIVLSQGKCSLSKQYLIYYEADKFYQDNMLTKQLCNPLK